MGASIHPHPYQNAAGCRLMCNKTAPWEIGAPNAPGHLALSVCDQHAREIVRNIPDAFAAELGALVVEKFAAGGEAARVIWDHIRAIRGEASPLPAGLPDVSTVVSEVQSGTEWGNALLEALLPVLESEGEENPMTDQTKVTHDGGTGTGVEPGAPYTEVDGKFICAGCGTDKDTKKAIKAHLPHCKGRKEGAQD